MCTELENEWTKITQSDSAAAVSSGTSALRLALQALEVGSGDEVIIPGYACTSLHSAVLSVGATPVLADIKPDLTIDWADISRRFTDKTKAIIVIHLFGAKAEVVNAYVNMKFNSISVIEDFSHGIFTQRGTLGIASHGPTKLIASCSGGIVSGNKELIDKVRDLRSYVDKPVSTKMNDLPNDLSASIALEQLERLDEIKRIRNIKAANYTKLLLLPPRNNEWNYRYTIQLENHLAGDISTAMKAKGVFAESPVYDYRLHTDWPRDLPVTDDSFRSILSLPFHENITQEEQEQVISVLGECLK